MYTLETLATITHPPQAIVEEGSWGSRVLGSCDSTMTLYRDGTSTFIEWDIPAIEATENIGLELEGKLITGYDGVCSFPRPAVEWLKSLGYTFADDVI